MASDADWVEIRCPRTGEPMFANLGTGECLWEAPVGATVKSANDNQWWELFDPVSKKNYYHNSTSNKTVWKKPAGAEILPLSKLQPAESRPADRERHDASHMYQEDVLATTTTPTLDRNSLNSKLPPISPYAVKPNHQAAHAHRPNKQGKLPPPIANKPATIRRPIAKTTGEETPGSTIEARDDPPPLTQVRQMEVDPDPIASVLRPAAYNQGYRSIEDLSNIADSEAELNGASSDGGGDPDIPASRDPRHSTGSRDRAGSRDSRGVAMEIAANENKSNMDKLKQNRHELRYSSFHDYTAPSKYTEQKNKTLPGQKSNEDSPVVRRHSAELSPAPNKDKKQGSKKPGLGRSPTSPIPKAPQDKDFVKKNINRTRGMFKKVSIATMLAYSKESIKKPIILTQDKDVRKNAVDCFKNLQEFMGDCKAGKNLKDRERLKKAVELTYTAWQKSCFRDEFFMQVIKQTTCNTKTKSLEWGWKLLSAYLYYFPPTIRFQSYLEGYLYKNKENDLNHVSEVPVMMYAEYCHDRLGKMVVRGAKHGQKKPTVDEISHAMQLPFKKSMFGATLEEVMELQRDTHPNHYLPWVMTLLADKVLEFGGFKTEGIFRVPGDIDRVGTLKVSIDNGDYVHAFPTSDAPVCASLLKEWLRELYDPVIIDDSYQKCLDNCDQAGYCSAIIQELPDINRLVVTYVIKFLQGFIKDDIIGKTKMTADNLAMVFAPNLLRCPSNDLQVAMDNSKWEMTFVRTLINHMDTSYMEGIV